VEVEGASDTDGSINDFQRSRQFKLRAVLLKPADCEDVNLLVKTTVEWSATAPDATIVQFPTDTKEVVIPSNTLAYGKHTINVVVVSRYTFLSVMKIFIHHHHHHQRISSRCKSYKNFRAAAR